MVKNIEFYCTENKKLTDLIIKIGFLEFRWIDLLDVIIVGLLIFQIYKLIRGSLAFNIFIGFIIFYFLWLAVRFSGMELLSGIMNQFISMGVVALLIVFQPEVRKFLLYLGKGGQLKQPATSMWGIFNRNAADRERFSESVPEILLAVENLKKNKLGAILVFSQTSRMQMIASSGVLMDSIISSKLIESVFEKTSPLHDGAIIINDFKIVAAGCVLPVSDNSEQASRLGLRHRAAIGITEVSDAIAIVVSEEKGTLSYARNGRLINDITINDIKILLSKYFLQED
jgi:diadenylate cyclase